MLSRPQPLLKNGFPQPVAVLLTSPPMARMANRQFKAHLLQELPPLIQSQSSPFPTCSCFSVHLLQASLRRLFKPSIITSSSLPICWHLCRSLAPGNRVLVCIRRSVEQHTAHHSTVAAQKALALLTLGDATAVNLCSAFIRLSHAGF